MSSQSDDPIVYEPYRNDVFITGDVYYHTAIDAKLDGLNIIDPGHNVEKVVLETTREA